MEIPRSTQWSRANPERARATAARSRAKHREASNARRRAAYVYDPEKWRKNLRLAYGITPEQYDALYEKQDGRCAICREPERAKQNGKTVRLGVDHDHATGTIRGLLCRGCNRAVGTLENRALVEAIRAYLKPPSLEEVA
jgi:hypothetical protein